MCNCAAQRRHGQAAALAGQGQSALAAAWRILPESQPIEDAAGLHSCPGAVSNRHPPLRQSKASALRLLLSEASGGPQFAAPTLLQPAVCPNAESTCRRRA